MTWSVISGGGTINSSGLYTAPSTAGTATVQAAGGGFTKTTSVTIKVGAPTVANPASASPSPATGTTVNLSVLGAYAAGENSLTYTWATTGTPPAPVTFTINGSNTAKNTVAIFTKAGVLQLPSNNRRPDRPKRHQQRQRDGESDAYHNHRQSLRRLT